MSCGFHTVAADGWKFYVGQVDAVSLKLAETCDSVLNCNGLQDGFSTL